MDYRVLDHAATEAAIKAADAYADDVEQIAVGLRRLLGSAKVVWQGQSYERFREALQAELGRLDEAVHSASSAAYLLRVGYRSAQDAEREAERLAARDRLMG
jgi:uncharacterized protein YukE